VASHMCSVKSSGLFHRVSCVCVCYLNMALKSCLIFKGIVESYPFGVELKELGDYTKLGHRFAKALGCGTNDVNCIKEKVMNNYYYMGFS